MFAAYASCRSVRLYQLAQSSYDPHSTCAILRKSTIATVTTIRTINHRCNSRTRPPRALKETILLSSTKLLSIAVMQSFFLGEAGSLQLNTFSCIGWLQSGIHQSMRIWWLAAAYALFDRDRCSVVGQFTASVTNIFWSSIQDTSNELNRH